MIRRTRQFRQDIVEVYRYVHARNPQAAERVLDAIERTVRSLEDTPGIGRQWPSADVRLAGMRVALVIPYRNYLLFFRAVPGGIEVFRLIHGRRLLTPLVDDIELTFDE